MYEKNSEKQGAGMVKAVASILAVAVCFAAPVAYLAPEPTPDPLEVDMLAKALYGEARGVTSTTEKAAVVWCILNRVDSEEFPYTVEGVLTEPKQFTGYSQGHPVEEELRLIAKDVMERWHMEWLYKLDSESSGRVLPREYLYFHGDGEKNYFRNAYRNGKTWDWSVESPYKD